MSCRILFILCLASLLVAAQTKIVSHSDRAITLDFTLPEVIQSEMNFDGQDYTHFTYDGARHMAESGSPMAPYTLTRVAIPPSANIHTPASLRYTSILRVSTSSKSNLYQKYFHQLSTLKY